jgi:hypothetical protein
MCVFLSVCAGGGGGEGGMTTRACHGHLVTYNPDLLDAHCRRTHVSAPPHPLPHTHARTPSRRDGGPAKQKTKEHTGPYLASMAYKWPSPDPTNTTGDVPFDPVGVPGSDTAGDPWM